MGGQLFLPAQSRATGDFAGFAADDRRGKRRLQRAGLSSDFLWGFNPVMFQQNGIRTALRWMIIDHWGVNTDF